MCRLACFMGNNGLQLSDLVIRPKHSILRQSYDARERQPHTVEHLVKSSLNGDGFGVGWYSNNQEDDKPCVFTSVLPAWNNCNLARLAEKVYSPIIFAHVRAAYPGMPVSEQNCHPFVDGKYMFMHNGCVGDFWTVRRALLSELDEEAYNSCQSFHSDSAVCFALFLNQMPDTQADYTPFQLVEFMNKTLQTICNACKDVGCEERSILNFVVSDGKSVIATKYANSGSSASLYVAAGTEFAQKKDTCTEGKGEADFEVIRSDRRTKMAIVASEPITSSDSAWTKVPENHMVVLTREKERDINVMFLPIQNLERSSSIIPSMQVLESISSGAALKAKSAGGNNESPRSTFNKSITKELPDDILTGHKGPILSMCVDKEAMYTGGEDGRIGIWDMSLISGKLKKLLEGHSSPVLGIAATTDCIYTAGGNKIFCFSKSTFEMIEEESRQVTGSGPLLSICIMDNVLVFAGQDACFKTIEIPAQSALSCRVRKAHNSFIQVVIDCGQYLCTGGADTMVKVWDKPELEQKAVLRGHKGPITAFATCGCFVLSGSRDNTIRVWDMEVLCCRHTIFGHQNDIVGLACFVSSSNDKCKDMLCSVSLDCTCRIWDLDTWECIQVMSLTHHPRSCGICGAGIYIGDEKGFVTHWGLDNLKIVNPDFETERCISPTPSVRAMRVLSLNESGIDGVVSKEKYLVESLRQFIGIKSVSGNACYREECFRGAKFVLRLLEKCGAITKMVQQEDKNPLVFARFEVDPNKPTVTFYGHYDVQPALEQTWKSDPFKMKSVDGYFYGRGTTDNKGPILAFIFAIVDLIEESGGIGKLPLNIALILEGEEENGSRGFKEALESNKHWFGDTRIIVISNTLWIGKEKPCITYGMRGMITMSVAVKGPQKDLHSGNEGGVFNEPMTDLVKLLSTLLDSSNKVLIPGFYDGINYDEISKKSSTLDVLIDHIDIGKYSKAIGLSDLSSSDMSDLLCKKWLLPTLSVVDVRTVHQYDQSSYYSFGPTRFSVIPHHAVGQISIRFVANQDPQALVKAVEDHITSTFSKFNSSNTVSMVTHNIGEAWNGNVSHPLYGALSQAVCKCWGEKPLFTYEGGTMPVTSTLEKVLEAPALLIPMGQSTDNPHLANERIRSMNLFKGRDVMKTLVNEVVDVINV